MHWVSYAVRPCYAWELLNLPPFWFWVSNFFLVFFSTNTHSSQTQKRNTSLGTPANTVERRRKGNKEKSENQTASKNSKRNSKDHMKCNTWSKIQRNLRRKKKKHCWAKWTVSWKEAIKPSCFFFHLFVFLCKALESKMLFAHSLRTKKSYKECGRKEIYANHCFASAT